MEDVTRTSCLEKFEVFEKQTYGLLLYSLATLPAICWLHLIVKIFFPLSHTGTTRVEDLYG